MFSILVDRCSYTSPFYCGAIVVVASSLSYEETVKVTFDYVANEHKNNIYQLFTVDIQHAQAATPHAQFALNTILI